MVLKSICIGVSMLMSASLFGQIKSAMTLNIRYDNPGDGENRWDNRKEELVALLSFYHPDVIGLQEGLVHQLDYIQQNLKGYKMIGVGRDDGKQKGEYTAIFYDTAKLQLMQQATFWLSRKPDTISKGWDAALERICTYGVFKNIQTEEEVFVFNTHYDHIGQVARVKSSKLLVKQIRRLTKRKSPVVLMGDFNSTPDQKPIQLLQRKFTDGATVGLKGPVGTFNSFDRQALLENRIDYIFYKNLDATAYQHIDAKLKNDNWVSDHLPVYIEF